MAVTLTQDIVETGFVLVLIDKVFRRAVVIGKLRSKSNGNSGEMLFKSLRLKVLTMHGIVPDENRPDLVIHSDMASECINWVQPVDLATQYAEIAAVEGQRLNSGAHRASTFFQHLIGSRASGFHLNTFYTSSSPTPNGSAATPQAAAAASPPTPGGPPPPPERTPIATPGTPGGPWATGGGGDAARELAELQRRLAAFERRVGGKLDALAGEVRTLQLAAFSGPAAAAAVPGGAGEGDLAEGGGGGSPAQRLARALNLTGGPGGESPGPGAAGGWSPPPRSSLGAQAGAAFRKSLGRAAAAAPSSAGASSLRHSLGAPGRRRSVGGGGGGGGGGGPPPGRRSLLPPPASPGGSAHRMRQSMEGLRDLLQATDPAQAMGPPPPPPASAERSSGGGGGGGVGGGGGGRVSVGGGDPDLRAFLAYWRLGGVLGRLMAAGVYSMKGLATFGPEALAGGGLPGTQMSRFERQRLAAGLRAWARAGGTLEAEVASRPLAEASADDRGEEGGVPSLARLEGWVELWLPEPLPAGTYAYEAWAADLTGLQLEYRCVKDGRWVAVEERAPAAAPPAPLPFDQTQPPRAGGLEELLFGKLAAGARRRAGGGGPREDVRVAHCVFSSEHLFDAVRCRGVAAPGPDGGLLRLHDRRLESVALGPPGLSPLLLAELAREEVAAAVCRDLQEGEWAPLTVDGPAFCPPGIYLLELVPGEGWGAWGARDLPGRLEGGAAASLYVNGVYRPRAGLLLQCRTEDGEWVDCIEGIEAPADGKHGDNWWPFDRDGTATLLQALHLGFPFDAARVRSHNFRRHLGLCSGVLRLHRVNEVRLGRLERALARLGVAGAHDLLGLTAADVAALQAEASTGIDALLETVEKTRAFS